MKLNKLFLMGAMGLGLFACSDELNVENGQNGGNAQEGTTYAAITLKFGEGSTARNIPGDYDDADANQGVNTKETAVKTLRIVVVSGTTVEVNKFYKTGYTEGDASADGAVINAKEGKYLISMTPGAKTFYAIVNEDAAFAKTETTKAKLDEYLANPVAKTTSVITADDKGFMMTSVEPVNVDISPNVTAGEAPAQNAVNVEVDRVVAKITVKKAATITSPLNNVTLGKVEVAIGNADLNATVIPTSNTTDKAGFYRMQKSLSSDYTTPYYSFAPTKNEAHTAPVDDDFVNITTGTAPNDYVTPFYCLENIHAEGNYMQKNTTYAAIRAEIFCTKVVNFTVANAGDETNPNYTLTWNNDVTNTPGSNVVSFRYLYGPEELRGRYVLESYLETNVETWLKTLGVTDESMPTTMDEKLTTLFEKFKAINTDFSISEKYDGHGYYEVWPNLVKGTGVSPIYRNNWYELTITKLTLPGKPAIEIEDKPIEYPTNAEVTVKVRDWRKVQHNVDLQ